MRNLERPLICVGALRLDLRSRSRHTLHHPVHHLGLVCSPLPSLLCPNVNPVRLEQVLNLMIWKT
jgi:hypothetical protein